MDFQKVGLSKSEYDSILKILDRNPNYLELELIGVMWSEHCSYKSTRPLLKTFPQEGKYVLQGPGENAGVVDMGEGWGFAFKVESHNHPSAVAPFHGAATGVGGIMRDIIAMGARPSVAMDGLFLGDPLLEKTQTLSEKITEGTAFYGNTLGIPIVGGKTFYSPAFNDNPLVNVFGAGFVRLDKITSSQTAKPGEIAVILGSKTGRDGIAGASFASRELDDAPQPHETNVQIGDPFEEKLLIECCLDILENNLITSMQDMGAAGILSSSSEIAQKSGCGIDIQVLNIPLREEGMEPWEIFLSETQERMLLIVKEENLNDVFTMAKHYGLDCDAIGTLTDNKLYRVFKGEEQIASLPVDILGETPVINWPSTEPVDLKNRQEIEFESLATISPLNDLLDLLRHSNGRSKHKIWEQFDSMVQLHTIIGPGSPVAAIEVPETKRACLMTMEAEPWKCFTDPYLGASETMASSLRKIWLSGAEALGMTNCLNFASPEKPEKFYELEYSIKGLADTSRELGCPVVSGNVSLYNETPLGSIYPTPLVVTTGLIINRDNILESGKTKESDKIYLVGNIDGSLGASRYQKLKNKRPLGKTVEPNYLNEKLFKERAIQTAHKNLANSGRVISGGGLAVTLANEAIYSEIGMKIDLKPHTTIESLLFSEGGARALYSVPEENSAEFEMIWEGFPFRCIGRATGESFSWNNLFSVSLEELTKVFNREK